MEVAPKTGRKTETVHTSRMRSKERETIPEQTKVWAEPHAKHNSGRKVPVVYYLSRNGQLEHPHFIEVPLSSDGLYLRDVINRLNSLRGKGMAALYSWSSKRSYKNGFVWHDLAEDDFIYPAHGQEYVLKGSELVEGRATSFSDETASSDSKKPSPDGRKSGDDADFPAIHRRRNQSWSAIDLHKYKVYKAEASGDSVGSAPAAANASTQTDDKSRQRKQVVKEVGEGREERGYTEEKHESTELSRGDISPPPSDSSPETLESLMKADGKLIQRPESNDPLPNPTAINHPRLKASSVLMQLISCGSMSFRDCGPGKDHLGLSLFSDYKARLPRGRDANPVEKDAEGATVETPGFGGKKEGKKVVMMEDKEYFSGSLIETKKEEFPALKRSSSYDADRNSQLDLGEREIEGAKAKCHPQEAQNSASISETGR